VEFTPDNNPKHLRLGTYADKNVWNPEGKDWGKMPLSEKTLLVLTQPPFRREEWHQVVFTCENFNTGKPDGRVALYIDGQPVGSLSDRQHTYSWNGDDAVMLFADGVCFDCVGETSAVAKILCAQDSVILDAALASAPAVVDLLTQLCNMGCIAFESEE
jgi:hypothetical protein